MGDGAVGHDDRGQRGGGHCCNGPRRCGRIRDRSSVRNRDNESQKVAVEDCSTRSQANFPGAFTRRRNLVVGPLAMIGAGGTPYFHPEFGGQKFQLLVRNGHRVILELSRRTRRGAGLAYGPLPSGEVGLADAHRVVKFIACRRGEPSGSSADGRPVTFWSGGVLARSPRCVPLRIFVDDARAPRRAGRWTRAACRRAARGRSSSASAAPTGCCWRATRAGGAPTISSAQGSIRSSFG